MQLNIREGGIRNPYNIITDNDIDITNENHVGENLSNVINEQDKRIERLESNMKWMYRYGALGSGGSGGSGSGGSTKWSVIIWCGGKPLAPGNTITFPGEGYYSFRIEIHGGGSDSFNISFSYYTGDPKNPYRTETKSISSADNFTWEPSYKIMGNKDFTVMAQNQSTWDWYKVDGKQELVFPYITTAYKVTANYVLGNDPNTVSILESFTPSKNTILMSRVKNTGIMIGVNYNIAVALSDTSTTVTYNDWQDRSIVIDYYSTHITYPDGRVENDSSFNLSEKLKSNTSGVLYLPLYQDVAGQTPFIENNENGSFKQVNVLIETSLAGESEKITLGEFNFNDNLIPSGLFLNIRTDAGKLYNSFNTANTAQPKNQITIGDIIFKVTPYNGQLDTSRPYSLNVYLYDINENQEETLINEYTAIPLTDQQASTVVTAFSDPGIKRIHFVLATTNNEKYSVSYYINVKSFTANFDWYPMIEDSNEQLILNKPTYSVCYKRNEDLLNIDEENTNIPISKDSNIQMTANDRLKTITFDYTNYGYIKEAPHEYDMLFGLGLQYYSVNDTTKPILSINSFGSTETVKAIHTIFIFQDKISIARSETSVNIDGTITSLTSDDISIFIPLEDDYSPGKTLSEPTAQELEDGTFEERVKYHIFNIYKRLENIDDNNNSERSFSTYIDGVLEGVMKGFVTAPVIYDSITLYPGNYTINVLEYSLFYHAALTANTTRWLEDIDIDRYYKAYTEKIIYKNNFYNDTEKALFDEFSKFTYDKKNRIVVTSQSAMNIAALVQCPVLVLNFTDDERGRIESNVFQVRNQDNFMAWFEEVIEEGTEDTVKNVPVTLQWCDGKDGTLKTIYEPDTSTPAEFSVDRQGSSTKTYRCKNLELNAPKSRTDNMEYIFSPNMMLDTSDPEYTNSFLPEHSFTLKADVVDSSHTNNNAIGKFVNDNTTPFNAARYNNFQKGTNLVKNIKNCLIGFPVLLFLNTSFPEWSGNVLTGRITEKHYFLGIYNFNLGRNSYYNLGYKNIKPLEDIIENLGNKAPEGFAIYEISKYNDVQMDSMAGAEIQGNNPHYDFSQYLDDKILFGYGGVEGMWGDFIGNNNQMSNIKTQIKALCKETALAGGFTFTAVGKEMSNDPSDRYGYDKLYSKVTTRDKKQPVRIVNGVWTPALNPGEKYLEWVPNYQYQATRSQSGSTVMYTYDIAKDSGDNIIKGTLDNLIDLIVPRVITEGEPANIPRVDFKSLSEYYTTMMAFGMVDSPMKNLNVKSWNYGQTFYLAFYDMDTGLGKNNAGTYINYFAFSDFWRSIYTKYTNKGSGSNNYQNAWTMSQADIIRDYSPESFVDDETGSSFFDVPSSYLFAVAKYAKSIFKRYGTLSSDSVYNDIDTYDPSNIWGVWRQNTYNTTRGEGCLRNAQYFMKTYFNQHLSTIPQEAFNFNYRFKYLVREEGGFRSLDHMKFHGRGIAYTEWWLDGRLHILDAYFNVNSVDDIINTYEGGEIKASSTDQRYLPLSNNDVYMLNDAFVGENGYAQYTPASANEGGIFVKAKQYAPFIMKYTQGSERYLFPTDERLIHIPINFTGNVTAMYYGSKLWTDIESITPFIKQDASFKISSKYISSIKGNTRTCTNWNIDAPSLRTLSLTYKDYSGELSFNEKYQNLDEIDISESSIKLEVRNSPIRKLYASNMKDGTKLIALGLSKLEDVRISGGQFDDVQINSWSDNIKIPTSGKMKSKTITVSNDTSRFPEATLTVSDNEILKTLNVNGFTHIYVKGCPALTSIVFLDAQSSDDENISIPVKTLDIRMGTFNTDETYSFKIGNTENIIDLTNFTNLENICFESTTVTKIKLPVQDSVHNADNKRKIILSDHALSNCKNFINFENEAYNDLYISGEGTFYNCGCDTENGYRLIKSGSDTDPITYENISSRISNIYIDSSCESLKNTFYCASGKGKLNHIIASEFLRTRCTGHEVTNVTNIDNMFRNNSITYNYNTYYQEYLGRKPVNGDSIDPYCSLPLWGFVNCTSATDVFTDNDINFFNRYMFEEYKSDHSGKKLFDCLNYITLGTICNTFTHGTIDMFYPFMNKLTGIDFKAQTTITIYNPVPLTPYKKYDILYVNDLFVNEEEGISPSYITLLRNFTLSPDAQRSASGSRVTQIYSFKGLFDNDKNNVEDYKWSAAHTYNLTLQNFMVSTYRVNTFDENINSGDGQGSYVNVLFRNIVPSYIVNSFNGFETENHEKLKIYTMFNWEFVKERTTNLFCDSYAGTSNMSIGGINVNKQCTYTEFADIWNNLLQSTRLKAISSIFTDCYITSGNWTIGENITNIEFKLSDSVVNESITTVPKLFANLKLIKPEDDTHYYPINITSSIFRCMKSIVYVQSIFENTYMQHAIPFDVFGKRKKSSEIQNCRIKKGNTGTDADYVDGTLTTYDYYQTIQNMSNAFYNITFHSREEATFRNANYNKYELNYATITGDDDTKYYDYYIRSAGTLVKGTQPSEIVDMQKLWVDLDHTNPETNPENELTKTKVMEDASLIPNVYKGPKIDWEDPISHEITRQIKDYSGGAVGDVVYRNYYTNLTNFCSCDTAGFVVSPDIFRCCSRGCNIDGSICYNRTNILDPIIMNGMIPPSLFDGQILKTMNFSGLFNGLNIVPIELPYQNDDRITVIDSKGYKRMGNEGCLRHNTYYQYILSNFTEIDDISNCFNFMLLLPSSRSTFTTTSNDTTYESERESQHFIMFGNDSFTSNVVSYKQSLPVDYAKILQDDDEAKHDFFEADNGIYFNITRSFINFGTADVPEIEYATGINKVRYHNMMLDNIVSSDIAKILEGYTLSRNNSLLINRDLTSETSVVFYQVGGNNTGFVGLSSNARVQANYTNGGWFPTKGGQYNICKSSLPQGFIYEHERITEFWDNYNFKDLLYKLIM